MIIVIVDDYFKYMRFLEIICFIVGTVELDEQKQLEWEETSPMAVFGTMRRQDQMWKRYQVDGGGRWPGNPYQCSSRFGLVELGKVVGDND